MNEGPKPKEKELSNQARRLLNLHNGADKSRAVPSKSILGQMQAKNRGDRRAAFNTGGEPWSGLDQDFATTDMISDVQDRRSPRQETTTINQSDQSFSFLTHILSDKLLESLPGNVFSMKDDVTEEIMSFTHSEPYRQALQEFGIDIQAAMSNADEEMKGINNPELTLKYKNLLAEQKLLLIIEEASQSQTFQRMLYKDAQGKESFKEVVAQSTDGVYKTGLLDSLWKYYKRRQTSFNQEVEKVQAQIDAAKRKNQPWFSRIFGNNNSSQ